MAVMSGSQAAKDHFSEDMSYTKFVDAIKSLGQPSKDLLTVLLDLVSPCSPTRGNVIGSNGHIDSETFDLFWIEVLTSSRFNFLTRSFGAVI